MARPMDPSTHPARSGPHGNPSEVFALYRDGKYQMAGSKADCKAFIRAHVGCKVRTALGIGGGWSLKPLRASRRNPELPGAPAVESISVEDGGQPQKALMASGWKVSKVEGGKATMVKSNPPSRSALRRAGPSSKRPHVGAVVRLADGEVVRLIQREKSGNWLVKLLSSYREKIVSRGLCGAKVITTENPWSRSGDSPDLDIFMTRAQAREMSRGGRDAYPFVKKLMKAPSIAKQLAKIDPAKLRRDLKGYGAWEDLDNHEENLARLLWLRACDIGERMSRRTRPNPGEKLPRKIAEAGRVGYMDGLQGRPPKPPSYLRYTRAQDEAYKVGFVTGRRAHEAQMIRVRKLEEERFAKNPGAPWHKARAAKAQRELAGSGGGSLHNAYLKGRRDSEEEAYKASVLGENPGAPWHNRMARTASRLKQEAKRRGQQHTADVLLGAELAHKASAKESLAVSEVVRRIAGNPASPRLRRAGPRAGVTERHPLSDGSVWIQRLGRKYSVVRAYAEMGRAPDSQDNLSLDEARKALADVLREDVMEENPGRYGGTPMYRRAAPRADRVRKGRYKIIHFTAFDLQLAIEKGEPAKGLVNWASSEDKAKSMAREVIAMSRGDHGGISPFVKCGVYDKKLGKPVLRLVRSFVDRKEIWKEW